MTLFLHTIFTVRHSSRTLPEAAADSSNESLMVILITCKGLNVSGSLDCKSARSEKKEEGRMDADRGTESGEEREEAHKC